MKQEYLGLKYCIKLYCHQERSEVALLFQSLAEAVNNQLNDMISYLLNQLIPLGINSYKKMTDAFLELSLCSIQLQK